MSDRNNTDPIRHDKALARKRSWPPPNKIAIPPHPRKTSDGIAHFVPSDLRAKFTQGDSGSPGENLQFSAGVNIGVPAERFFGGVKKSR